jgi:hypothetical protein
MATDIKVFVFTYDRYDSITTTKLLDAENINHITLCHSEEAKQKFIDAGRVTPETIVVTGRPKGLANNRNAALDMMQTGEWAVFLVDDYQQGYEFNQYDGYEHLDLDGAANSFVNKAFKREITIGKLIERGVKNIPLAELIGAKLIGYALHENPFFLKEKYKTYCLADGRAWLVKKTHMRFDENVQLIDDTCWTAKNLQTFGRVLVDNWVIPKCKRYTKGAYGTMEERMPQKIKEARYLCEMYGDVVRYAQKAGWPPNSHVQIKTNNNALKITKQIINQIPK